MLDDEEDLESFPGFPGTAVRLLNDAKRAGEPISIHINGKVSLLIGNDESFRKLIDLAGAIEGIEAIRKGIKELEEGKGIGLGEFTERLREKHGMPL